MSIPRFTAPTLCLAAALACSCAVQPTARPRAQGTTLAPARTDLDVQSVVMNMGDEAAIALAEALGPIIADPAVSPRAREYAQSMLRAGTASAYDIAVGPNPDAALLDMLVLTSLGTWSFERGWEGAGIVADAAQRAVERLRRGESAIWKSTDGVLSAEQTSTLLALIEDWKTANPERRDVAFVRFDDFINIRDRAGASNRVKATGLLREVTEASAVVDSTRLLGERIVWYAGRYPSLVGLQVENTAYRMAGQPELRNVMQALDASTRAAEALAARVRTLDADMTTQQDLLFSKIAREREEAVLWAKTALEESAGIIVKDIDTRAAAARDAAITQAFDRLARERREFLDDLEKREGTLRGMASELRDTIGATTTLANELTGTVDAIDRIVARFDQQPAPGHKPLEITDIRDTAIEATRAAERMTGLLEQVNQLTSSDRWDKGLAHVDHATTELVDRVFWRGLTLVLVLLVGLTLIRLVPQRAARGATAATAPHQPRA